MSYPSGARYADMLGEVEASMGRDFMFKLDALVGERMAEAQATMTVEDLCDVLRSSFSPGRHRRRPDRTEQPTCSRRPAGPPLR